MVPDVPEDGKLANNIIYFARALRRAGIAVGPGQIVQAIRAVHAVGFADRADVYWTLRACFLTRGEQSAVFAQMFRLFWRDPRYLEHMMAMMMPAMRGVSEDSMAAPAARQAADALLDGPAASRIADNPATDNAAEVMIDASGTTSANATFHTMDFERMSADEVREARRVIARFELPAPPLISRRLQRADQGHRVDRARTLQSAARRAGHMSCIHRQVPRRRRPDLVALCDISGSMSAYSRTLLHFLHAIMHRANAGWSRVHAFTFGTTLTNITPMLAKREVDDALQAAGQSVEGWNGGTLIGACLREFNVRWSRRVLSRGALVLLISDGLESGDTEQLITESRRLQRTARRVIWLNPLLRWEGFAPNARGIRALLPHVDCFRSAHNLATLAALAEAVRQAEDRGDRDRLLAMMQQDSGVMQ
ncbi:MAG: VWA domain-containing protein [Rhodobacteraceae bacterium]|nr:VWA domain-containing protein [Paracoccaceae bacterium]